MKTKKGFTLIELLIVIAIIGILSAALLPTILNAPARGRDSARIGHLNQLVAGLEAWNSDKGEYPQAPESVDAGCIGGAGLATPIDDPFGTQLAQYFSGGNPPKDPQGPRGTAGDENDVALGGCLSNGLYYYKYLGEVNVADYILATKMELATANNTIVPPSTVGGGTLVDYACKDTATCTYYILVK